MSRVLVLKTSIVVLLLWGALSWICDLPRPAAAQTTEKQGTSAGLDLSYVPYDGVLALVIRPRQILTDETINRLSLDKELDEFQQATGVDVKNCEEIFLFVSPEANTLFVVRAKAPWDSAAVIKQLMPEGAEKKLAGNREYVGSSQPGLPYCYAFPDPKTMIVADDAQMRKMLLADGKNSRLGKALQNADTDGSLAAVFVNSDEMRQVLRRFTKFEEESPHTFARDIPQLVSKASLNVHWNPELKIRLVMEADDKEAATKLKSQTNAAHRVALLALWGLADRPGKTQRDPEDAQATKEALELAERISARFAPVQVENRVQIEIAGVGKADPLLNNLVVAFRSARMDAQQDALRSRSANNLKQLGLAWLNHEAATRRLPQNIKSADGKPLLSWRVAILPFLEEGGLYEEFKRDEPWDSPHNLKLLEKMPSILKVPGSKLAEEGKTRYLAVSGKGMSLDPNVRVGLQEIFDGTSKTIGIVEVGEEKAVPWTKPDDFEVDEKNPAAGLGNVTTFNAVFLDGHVQTLKTNLKPATLKALFMRADGEIIDDIELE